MHFCSSIVNNNQSIYIEVTYTACFTSMHAFLCSALMAIEQLGFFSVPHLLWQGGIRLCNIFELVFTLCHKCNKYNCLPWKMLNHAGNCYMITRRKQLHVCHPPDTVTLHRRQFYYSQSWYCRFHMLRITTLWFSESISPSLKLMT